MFGYHHQPQPPSADLAPAARALDPDELVALAQDFAQNLHRHPRQRFRVYRHKKSGIRLGPHTPLALIIEWEPAYDTSKTSPPISVTTQYDASPHKTFQELCVAAAQTYDPRNRVGYICRWSWLRWANRDIDGIRVKFEVDSFPPAVYPLVVVHDDGSEYKLHKAGYKNGKPSKGPGGAPLPKPSILPSHSDPSRSQAQNTSVPEQPPTGFYRAAFPDATTDSSPYIDHRRSHSRQSRHQSKTTHRHRHSQDLSLPSPSYPATQLGRSRPDFSTQDAVAEYRAQAAAGEPITFPGTTSGQDQAQSSEPMDYAYTDPVQPPATTQESTYSTLTQTSMPPPPIPFYRPSCHSSTRSEARGSRTSIAGLEKPQSG